MTRPAPLTGLLAGALLAGALLAGAAGCAGTSTPAAPAGGPAPSGAAPGTGVAGAPAAPTAQRTPAPAGLTARAVYYLGGGQGGGGPRLYREFHRRPATRAVVRDAVEAMLTERPDDPDYTTVWPSGTRLRGATVDGSVAVVDLTGPVRSASAGAAAEQVSLQQLVHTVTAAAPELRSVRLLVDGRPVPTLWGHVDTRRPLSRAPAAEVLAPVWLTRPADGTVRRGGVFGGEASVFEATVSWELRRGGVVVRSGFSTAEAGAPARGRWSATADVPPGDYVVRACESSARDGSPRWVDDKPLRVTR